MAANKIATGHFPWCTEHEGESDDSESYCRTRHLSWSRTITMSSGSKAGAPILHFEGRAGSLHRMSIYEAGAIGGWITLVAGNAHHSPFGYAVSGKPDDEVDQ